MKKLILGSSSARRLEILSYFCLPFEQHTPLFNEEQEPFLGDPVEYARRLAMGKSDSLLARFPEDLVLTADTIVHCENTLLEKPEDEEKAFSMLSLLAGKWHTVYTALVLRCSEKTEIGVEATKVHFHPLTPTQIRLYLRNATYRDKSGGYTIQGIGALLQKEIHGCYTNVLGLPVSTLTQLLQKMGIDLWHYLEGPPL